MDEVVSCPDWIVDAVNVEAVTIPAVYDKLRPFVVQELGPVGPVIPV